MFVFNGFIRISPALKALEGFLNLGQRRGFLVIILVVIGFWGFFPLKIYKPCLRMVRAVMKEREAKVGIRRIMARKCHNLLCFVFL